VECEYVGYKDSTLIFELGNRLREANILSVLTKHKKDVHEKKPFMYKEHKNYSIIQLRKAVASYHYMTCHVPEWTQTPTYSVISKLITTLNKISIDLVPDNGERAKQWDEADTWLIEDERNVLTAIEPVINSEPGTEEIMAVFSKQPLSVKIPRAELMPIFVKQD
jgi:hypothetical protein